MTLRQGDCPSSVWFGYGIDPLLLHLEKLLKGIEIFSEPVLGPTNFGEPRRLDKINCTYKLSGYCDDVKPAITSIEEFYIVDRAVKLFEGASGCELHRDIKSNKCKILLLGSWKKWDQTDIPLYYLSKSEFIDMLGVELFSNYTKTRQENGNFAVELVKKKIDSWKGGKFMPFTDRAHSINSFILSKLWYRMASIELRKGDFEKQL